MVKKLLGGILILGLVLGMWGSGALAASTADVTATVTVKNISIQVSDGSIAYGALSAGGTQSTLPGGVNDMQTATNNGNVEEDFNIKGFDVDTGCTWELADTQGSEQYFHKFCNDTDNDCSNPPTNYSPLNEESYSVLDTNIAKDGTVDFQLQIGVPSSTSCTSEATVKVTVQAVDSS